MQSPLPGATAVWSPHGVTDTLDASTSIQGSMQSLQNLIPDPTSKELWQCRPAAIKVTDLVAKGGFATATFISALITVGTRTYGMYSDSSTGTDKPFCYDIPTATFIPVAGITTANTPTSPAQVGAWNPPSMALVGAYIIVTHPGFNGANGFFGVINVLNPFALTWISTNTAPVALVFPPQWVESFNGRAFFLVNPPAAQPAAYMSDSLNAVSVTNANQILTFGDNTPLTVAAGLGLNNLVTGGMTQALMIFKGVTNIYQVTGDYALGNLQLNSLSVATGTAAPNSVTSSEKGLLFMAPDGIRQIDFTAQISDPIGKDGEGITVPFLFTQTPSRVCASFNTGIFRIQIQNSNLPGAPQQEWWYDFVRDLWSGPHTTNVSLIVAYSNTFIATLQGAGAKLWQTDPVQSVTSTYVENGQQLSFNFWTSYLPDTDQMSEIAMIESTIYMAFNAKQNVSVEAITQDGTILDGVVVGSTGFTVPTIWDNFQWGQANWYGSTSGGSGSTPLYPRQLPWHVPIVFRRMSIMATGLSAPGFKIGRMHLRFEILGYLQMDGGFGPGGGQSNEFELDNSTLDGPNVLG